MIKNNKKFNKEKVVGGYRLKDIADNLIDIIPAIDQNIASEMDVLKTWQNHFEGLDVPFAITAHVNFQAQRTVNYYSLWKERRI